MNARGKQWIRSGASLLAWPVGLAWACLAWACLALMSLIPAGLLEGQGFLMPEGNYRMPRIVERPATETYRIREFSIDASIRDQIAQTQVTQVFENLGQRPIEASFVFPIPYDGAIDKMTFLVDGKEYEAKLLKADEARQVYEGYVRRNQDPALLEWMGHGMFRTSVFPIPAGATRTVTLKYSQLLKSEGRLTDYRFPLTLGRFTSQPIEKLALRVAIESREKLRSIYSPTHNIDVSRDDDFHATVRHSAAQTVPANDFRLVFDSAEGKVAASLISCWPEGEDQGYFLLLASPELKPETVEQGRKSVIFVVDQSGSMSGQKIEQAREAAKFVVQNLRKDDLFNVIRYENEVAVMSPEMLRYNDQSRQQAVGFVNSITSGGGTNIHGALQSALKMVSSGDEPTYLVFLTDGLPTIGQVDELAIARDTLAANRFGARIISFGVGYDVNSRLLDRLSRENHGQTEYVRPDEDIEACVARLFSRIASPVLAEMKVDFRFDRATPESGESVGRIYPKGVTDLFAGSQVVLLGRYRESGPVRVNIAGKLGKEARSFDFDLQLAPRGKVGDNGFIRQLWAVRRIGEIIDLIDLNGKNQELVDELVQLSLKHGIVTPYTSYLADENSPLAQLSDGREQRVLASANLELLNEEKGAAGFSQRAGKQLMKSVDNLQVADSANSGGIAGMSAASPSSRGGGIGSGAGQIPNLSPSQQAYRTGGAGGGGGQPQFEAAQESSAKGVRKAGSVTLYVRGKDLVAENAVNIDPEKQKAEIREIVRFSDEYFQLIKENSSEENQILAEQRADETLLVSLRGQAYRIR